MPTGTLSCLLYRATHFLSYKQHTLLAGRARLTSAKRTALPTSPDMRRFMLCMRRMSYAASTCTHRRIPVTASSAYGTRICDLAPDLHSSKQDGQEQHAPAQHVPCRSPTALCNASLPPLSRQSQLTPTRPAACRPPAGTWTQGRKPQARTMTWQPCSFAGARVHPRSVRTARTTMTLAARARLAGTCMQQATRGAQLLRS